MSVYSSVIFGQTFITTFILSTLFFTISLYLLKHTEELRKELAHKIKYDNLTGVYSRDAFLTYVDKNNTPEKNDAFLLIDADYFKRINDTYGHGVGDQALTTITNALKTELRSNDKIGRIGGEEFAIHLRNTDENLALKIAERLRANVKNANSGFNFPDVNLSVSIGVVIYDQSAVLPTLLMKADEMLYKAKENGRDRVEHLFLNRALAA